jgi:two-component system sensor histidine kinase HydH
MSGSTATTQCLDAATEQAGELKDAFSAFSEVADRLRAAYEGLSASATRLDAELAVANERLKGQVDELENLSGALAAVLRAIPCGVVVAGMDGVVVMANPAAERILGRKGRELIGNPAERLTDVDGRPLLRLHEGPGPVAERMIATQDGARVVDGGVVSVTDTDGRELGVVEVLNDRSEVRALKEEVRRLDKLAELGRVAAIIAHEIRNPLSGIKGFASLLLRELEADKEHSGGVRFVRRILEGADRADAIIDSVLFLARPRALALAVVDAETLLLDALEEVATAKPLAMRSVAVVRRVEPAGLEVVCDRVRLLQALVNLIQNSAEAMGGKGRLAVSAIASGNTVRFVIEDSGPGVPVALRARLFEPFFTTKTEGAGLGLALVARIAELHGGSITVGSSDGGGAAFTLTVPSSQDPKEAFAS